MPASNIAEIQNRIHDLQSQIAQLSSQLLPESIPPAEDCAPGPNPARCEPEIPSDNPAAAHQSSIRILRDLMWQGRGGLAFHLCRALEAQGVTELEFRAESIRIWTLSSRADRRCQADSLALASSLQATCRPDDSLPLRMLNLASMIGLVRGLKAGDVQSATDRFPGVSELPAVNSWWIEYVGMLTTCHQRSAAWRAFPSHDAAKQELKSLALESQAESLRFAASCLMMAIRLATRHVRVSSRTGEKYILNAELARAHAGLFSENGEPTASPAVLEQAICELADEYPHGRTVQLVESTNTDSDSMVATALDGAIVSDSASVTAHPRAQSALLRLDDLEKSLDAALHPVAPPISPPPSPALCPIREARREAARERLQRYAERIADRQRAQQAGKVTIEVTSNSASKPAATTAEIELPRLASSPPVPPSPELSAGSSSSTAPVAVVSLVASAATPLALPEATPPEQPPQTGRPLAEPPARSAGILASSVALALRSDDGTQTWHPTVTHRRVDSSSLWSALMTPQSAIVAGLLAIAGAMIAGFGSRLAARSEDFPPAASSQAESSSELAGDFSVPQ